MKEIKAAVLEQVGCIKVKEVKEPVCGYGEVLVRVKACGICRTDLKCLTAGQRDLVLPRILGHELAGVVVDVGVGVDTYKRGQSVQVFPGITCGKCEYCRTGHDNLCHDLQIIGFNYNGGFAEYIRITEQGVKNGVLNPLLPKVDFREAAVAEPLACCINMQELLRLSDQDTLLIFGAGRLGLLNLKLAKAGGVKKIIAVETNETRMKLAEKHGFDYVINPLNYNLSAEIRAITARKGVDAVITCCPDPKAMDQGFEMLAKKGRFGFFSGLVMQEDIKIDLNKIHYKELGVVGAYGCSRRHNRQALKYITQKSITVTDLITQTIGLKEIEKGIKMVDSSPQDLIIVMENNE